MQLAEENLGMPVVERERDRTELYVCDELFFMGTGWEILPITELDGLIIGNGSMGRITSQLDSLYHDIVRGVSAEHMNWLTPVYSD